MSCKDLGYDHRLRRWYILSEDGKVFGLTRSESAELARLEREFGKTDLPKEMRS